MITFRFANLPDLSLAENMTDFKLIFDQANKIPAILNWENTIIWQLKLDYSEVNQEEEIKVRINSIIV